MLGQLLHRRPLLATRPVDIVERPPEMVQGPAVVPGPCRLRILTGDLLSGREREALAFFVLTAASRVDAARRFHQEGRDFSGFGTDLECSLPATGSGS